METVVYHYSSGSCTLTRCSRYNHRKPENQHFYSVDEHTKDMKDGNEDINYDISNYYDKQLTEYI